MNTFRTIFYLGLTKNKPKNCCLVVIIKNSFLDMSFSKERAISHDEARAYICCVCGRKVNTGGSKHVSPKLASLVCQFVNASFSVLNSFHPTGMCVTCRLTLSAYEKVIYWHEQSALQ